MVHLMIQPMWTHQYASYELVISTFLIVTALARVFEYVWWKTIYIALDLVPCMEQVSRRTNSTQQRTSSVGDQFPNV